ncbi:MAG: Stf0 sulfotransferase [Paracoccaceae bacterium]|nr:MAG: Stf0 sulfotransferase [Paracoccaceae bacterium]
MPPPRALIICTTPRSGSTLVCALLRASGVAGWPESWFRAEDRAEYEADWGTAPGDSAAFLAAAIRAGQGRDGTFGLRIQGATLAPLLAELRALHGAMPADPAVLERAFGPCRYVLVRRRDDVAQAVSRLKAEVSQVWHLDGVENDRPRATPAYDAARIDTFRAEAAAQNAMWQDWFATNGIAPRTLVYEEFAHAPAAAVTALLSGLGLSPAPGTVIAAPNRRMADAESALWAARYRAERHLPPGPVGR